VPTHISGFIDDVRYQAEWREQKAVEYPEDDRNQRSADALQALAEWIGGQPDDAPILGQLDAALGRLYASENAAEFGVTDRLGRYDFCSGPHETPDEFLRELIKDIEDHLQDLVTTEEEVDAVVEEYVGKAARDPRGRA